MTAAFSTYRRQWFTDGVAARRDVLAGIVVALALIPEAIGFSIIAGVDPRVGLYASVAIAWRSVSLSTRWGTWAGCPRGCPA
jgi:SulP family sulfate permease